MELTLTLTLEQVGCSQPHVSEKQPKHIGPGYVLHLPLADLKTVPQFQLETWGSKGMRAEPGQPLFLRTERKFVRVTFNRGDVATATMVYQHLSTKSRDLFKNWL